MSASIDKEHPNAARLRAFFEALGRRDLESMVGAISPDAVYHVPGKSVIAGEHAGLHGIGQLMGTLMQESEGTLRVQLLDVLANDQYAVTLTNLTAQHHGKEIDMNNVMVHRLDGEGRIAARWEYIEDQAVFDDFWS